MDVTIKRFFRETETALVNKNLNWPNECERNGEIKIFLIII